MMPADLMYVLSSQPERTAMNTARARRIAAQEAVDALARERKEAARAQRRTAGRRRWVWRWVWVRSRRRCTP